MWNWRYPVNDIRDEVRKARSNGETVSTLDNIEKLLDDLSCQYETLEKEDAENKKKDGSEFEESVNKQKEVIASSYEQAKQYSNIVILAGYAGLFTIWNFTKDNLEVWEALSVGLLTIISILIYIIFELYGAWLRTTQVKNQMNELLEAERLHKFPDEYGKGEMSRAGVFMAIWPYFFFSAIAFALCAASILIYSFISKLL